MIKDTNIQRSIVLPKAVVEQIQQVADDNYISFNAAVRKIIIDYFKGK